jgi:uncharacterized protein YktA (UPF0223 family)
MSTGLELMNAQASWNKGENDDKWCVRTPTGELLFILDGDFDEKSAMQVIHFGRKFEVRAFNEGVRQGKTMQKKEDLDELVRLKAAVKNLGEMNEQLSEQLDRHINNN